MARTSKRTQDAVIVRVPKLARAKMRQAAAAVLEAKELGKDGDAIVEVAKPILEEMRSMWMDAFVAEMCAALRTRR
jgi:hypothetical protein